MSQAWPLMSDIDGLNLGFTWKIHVMRLLNY